MSLPDLHAAALDRVLAEHETLYLAFWAPGCPACKTFQPTLGAAADAHPDLAFFRVNTHEEPGIAAAFDVVSVPQLVVIRDRIMVASQPGALAAHVLEDLIRKVRALDMRALRRSMEESPA